MRLTGGGRAALVLGVLAWGAAFALSSVTAALVAAAVSLAFAYALATLRPPRVEVERKVERARYQEGERVSETLTLRVVSPRAFSASVEERASPGLVSPDARWRARLRSREPHVRTLAWEARTWGAKTLGPLTVVVQDPLHLLELEVVEGVGQPLRVIPSVHSLGKFRPRAGNPEPALGVHSVSKPGDGFEFFALREYQPGDNIRRINWKASARSSSTVVNQVTRDSFARVVLVLDVRDKEALGEHEASARVRSGRAAAAVLGMHDRMKDHLTVLCVGDSPRKLSMAANPRLNDLLNELSEAPLGGMGSLEEAVRQNLTRFRPRSPVYLVTSGVLDSELARAITLIQALRANPILISPAPEGALCADAALDEAAKRSREDALAKARSLGIRVIDWPAGQSLEVALAVA